MTGRNTVGNFAALARVLDLRDLTHPVPQAESFEGLQPRKQQRVLDLRDLHLALLLDRHRHGADDLMVRVVAGSEIGLRSSAFQHARSPILRRTLEVDSNCPSLRNINSDHPPHSPKHFILAITLPACLLRLNLGDLPDALLVPAGNATSNKHVQLKIPARSTVN